MTEETRSRMETFVAACSMLSPEVVVGMAKRLAPKNKAHQQELVNYGMKLAVARARAIFNDACEAGTLPVEGGR